MFSHVLCFLREEDYLEETANLLAFIDKRDLHNTRRR